MSLEITQVPHKTLGSLTSKWNAVWHPLLFKIQREDYAIDTISEELGSPSATLVTLQAGAEDAGEAGDTIYVKSDNGDYDGNYTVLSWDGLEVVIDFDYVSDDTGGFINLVSARTDYKIQVRILEYTTGSPIEINDSYAEFRPNTEGLIKADLQSYLQPILSGANDFDYVSDNYKMPGLGQGFNIQYREYWKENGFGDWSAIDADNKFFASNSAKTTGDLHGQNMFKHVIFPSVPSSGYGKFLSKFEKPSYSEDLPFSLKL